MQKDRRVINKKASFDYQILERFEAGLVLSGPEIKSYRAGQASLNGAFVRPLNLGKTKEPELWLINSHFAHTPEPDRSRKVLMNRREIDRLIGRITEKGLTLVPLELYFMGNRLKLSVGLGKGKKQFEKREAIKKRDIERELQRSI